MARITVGPVIGEVTSATARVLIEVDSDADVTCVATDDGHVVSESTVHLSTNRPSAFLLSGLAANKKYTIGFRGVDAPRNGHVKTFPEDADRLNIAAVSCNFTIRRAETNLWADLRDRYVKLDQIDLLLHVGDQIYGDNAFHESCIIWKESPKASREERICDLYRRLYRLTWNDPATQEVLANVSNLMIWDDHEIRDDWGSLDNDRDSGSVEYQVGLLARRVYHEYQRQLWGSSKVTKGPEHHFHRWGKIGVLFLDQRGARSFDYHPSRPYLGEKQWQDLRQALEPSSGTFSAARALVVVTSVPLAFLSPAATRIGSVIMDDLMDHWSYGPHAKEQLEFVRLLRRWKDAGKGEREILAIGGDVHVGASTNIRHAGKTIFKQLITSPITNTPPTSYEFYGLQLLLKRQQSMGERYSFRHHGVTNKRNYGVVIVRIPGKGTPLMDANLVEANPKAKSTGG